jgi:hypothetical protein
VKPDSIVRIPDEDHLPDDVLAAYTLSYDPQGHLVMFRDVPTSASGDWYLSTVHYFDANGKTLVCFVRYATTTSGCTSVLRLRRFIYMDESGRVLRDTVSWSDAWHAPFIPDPARCRAQVPELPPISGVLEIPAQLRAFTPDEH